MILKEIATVKGGKRLPKTEELVPYKTEHPYIRIRDMYQSYPLELNSDFEYITQEIHEKIKKYTVNQGDVIIAVVGNTIGLVSLIGESLDGANLTENCNKLVNLKNYDNRFLYYYLNSKHGQDEIQKGIVGSSQPKLPIYNIEKFKIPDVDITIQIKIVSILESIDKKIKVNEKINRNLSEQAQILYKNWFVDFKPFGGNAPIDWIDSTLGDIAEIKTSTFRPEQCPDAIVEHYSIPALDDKHFPIFEIASGIKSNKYRLTKNSVMISKLNPETKRIWRPICLSDMPVCSTEFIIYEAYISSNKDYVYSILDSRAFSNYLCANVTGSTGSRQRAIPKATLEFEIKLPPEEVINDFCSMVSPIYDVMEKNEIENQGLAEARNTLLPKLMSGEIDISKLDI